MYKSYIDTKLFEVFRNKILCKQNFEIIGKQKYYKIEMILFPNLNYITVFVETKKNVKI